MIKHLISAMIVSVGSVIFTSCDQGSGSSPRKGLEFESGGIVRGDIEKNELALVFTGADYADGGALILSVLKEQGIEASFFFTGGFYDKMEFKKLIVSLKEDGHYLGAHSDDHLLYCDWGKRDSLLVTKDQFVQDLERNYAKMKKIGIDKKDAQYFLPPYEWYNDSISQWTEDMGLRLVNLTRGTLSSADYTTPDMSNYRNSEVIFQSVVDYEEESTNGLNGFILLMHIGTHPNRTDKFYNRLDDLIVELKNKGYSFKRIDKLLND